MWSESIKYEPVYSLGEDIFESMENMKRMEHILECLPGLDCGCCGSPTCKSLASDIVKSTGKARIEDCNFPGQAKRRRISWDSRSRKNRQQTVKNNLRWFLL